MRPDETNLTAVTQSDDIRTTLNAIIEENEEIVKLLTEGKQPKKESLRELLQSTFIRGFLMGAQHASNDDGSDDTGIRPIS